MQTATPRGVTYKSYGKGGRLVLHKRKPVRDPKCAAEMGRIRDRGIYSPGNRARALEEYLRTPWTENDRVRIVPEDQQL